MGLAQTINKRTNHILLYAITTIAGVAFFAIFLPFLVPISLAIIFAFGIAEGINKVKRRYPKRRYHVIVYTIAFSVIGTFVLLTAKFWSRVYNLTIGNERSKLVDAAKHGHDHLNSYIDKTLPKLKAMGGFLGLPSTMQIKEQLQDAAKRYFLFVVQSLGKFFSEMPDFLISIFIFSILLGLLLNKRQRIYDIAKKTQILAESDLDHLVDCAKAASYTTMFSNFVVGIVQGCVLTIGASLVGFNESAVIFLSTFVCSFFPIVGTAPIALLLCAIAYINGETNHALFMIGVAVLAGTIDNFIRPYLISNTEQDVNPIICLIGIIGAISLFGFAGLFIGPFLISFFTALWPYFSRVFADDYALNFLSKKKNAADLELR